MGATNAKDSKDDDVKKKGEKTERTTLVEKPDEDYGQLIRTCKVLLP